MSKYDPLDSRAETAGGQAAADQAGRQYCHACGITIEGDWSEFCIWCQLDLAKQEEKFRETY
jgi:hypothetical protein